MNQDIDVLLENKSAELVYAFDKILAYAFDLGEIEISATKNCVVFFKTQTFLVVRPMKKELNVKLYLEEPHQGYLFQKVAKYGKQYEHHIRVSKIEEVNERLLTLIKYSYALFNPGK